MFDILLIVLILMLLGSFPHWPYSRNWGWSPVSIIGTLLVIYIILVLLGHIELRLFGLYGRPALAP